MSIGTVHLPGYGEVPISVKRSLTSYDSDGTGTVHLFIAADLPDGDGGPGGGGEPLPIEEVA